MTVEQVTDKLLGRSKLFKAWRRNANFLRGGSIQISHRGPNVGYRWERQVSLLLDNHGTYIVRLLTPERDDQYRTSSFYDAQRRFREMEKLL